MSSWRRALGFGVLAWLIPFVVAFAAFPFRAPARPLFESIMSVTVTVTSVALGLAYLKRFESPSVRDGLLAGMVWLVICVAIDAPLMLLGGPMKMSLGAYMADIGLTYAAIPIVTSGLAAARGTVSTP